MTLTYRSKLYVARENNAGARAYGNPPPNANFDLVPFDTLNAMDDYEQILDQGLRGIAAMDFRAFQGVGVSNVTIECPFWMKEAGSFLTSMLGIPTTSTDSRVGTGNFAEGTLSSWRHGNDGTNDFNPETPREYGRVTTTNLHSDGVEAGDTTFKVDAITSVAANQLVYIDDKYAGVVKSAAGVTVTLTAGSLVDGSDDDDVEFYKAGIKRDWLDFSATDKSTWVMYEPRSHQFQLAETPESLVYVEQGNPVTRRWPGQRVSEISISYSSGEGSLTMSVTSTGLLSNPRDVPTTTLLPDNSTNVEDSVVDPGSIDTKPVKDRTTSFVESWRGELKILDDDGNVVSTPPSDFLLSMDITMSREVTPVHTARNDQSPLRIDPGRMECTGTLTLDYRIEDYRNRYLNKEQDRFRLIFVRPESYDVADEFDDTAAARTNRFRLRYNTQAVIFDFGKVDWGESAFEVDRSDTYLMGSVGWRALYHADFNGPVLITLWNNRDDYLYNTAQADLTA